MNENTSIQLFDKFKDISDIERAGAILAKSGFCGCDRTEQGQAIVLFCLSDNMPLAQWARTHDLIGGKPRKKAMSASADFLAKGAKIQWLNLGDDVKRNASGLPVSGEARAKITFENQTLDFAFSIEQATKCGLVKANSNWDKTPGNMLRARVCSNAIGVLCPSIYTGSAYEAADAIELDSTPSPALNLAPTKAEIKTGSPESDFEPVKPVAQKATEKPAEKVIDVESTATESAPAKLIAEVDANGKLTSETVAALVAAVGESNLDTAQKWFVSKSWLKENQTWSHISQKRAQTILDKPAQFIAAIGGSK